MTKRPQPTSFLLMLVTSVLVTVSLVSTACSGYSATTPASVPTPIIENKRETVRLAEIEFNVTLPAALEGDQTLYLDVLDEVTGLALNPSRTKMEKITPTSFKLKMPLPVGTILKYRYSREGKVTAIEYTSQKRQVRYRLFHVLNASSVNDIVAAWIDRPYEGTFGRIQGRVLESGSNSPIPNLMVAAGGQQTLTASDGTFLLEALLPGTHNLVVFAPDGSHTTFQQGAMVAAESTTPAPVEVSTVQRVNVTFKVIPPQDAPAGIPIRLVGSTPELGNMLADLRGGISTIAARAPYLSLQPDGTYSITLSLPAGLDLRYKYSLGDGFWNSELTADGQFQLRQLIVPSSDAVVENKIESWRTPRVGAITFKVNTPAETPPGETISIQFNPYGWTEPIPMWRTGSNQWVYILYNPLQLIGPSAYRVCRNDQCGVADDTATPGVDGKGKPFAPQKDPQVIEDTIKSWAWLQTGGEPITVTSDPIPAKPQTFTTGIELVADYHPSWIPYLPPTFQRLNQIQSRLVVLSPTWSWTNTNPPVVSAVTGTDAPWDDVSKMVNLARTDGINVALRPTTTFMEPSVLWWQSARRDADWWQSFFDRYETMLLNFADLGTQTGSSALILGDGSLTPALPNGSLADGTPSGVPDYSSERWGQILNRLRERFQGKIYWRLSYPADFKNLPEFLGQVDGFIVVMSGPIQTTDIPYRDAMRAEINRILESDIRALRDRFGKSVILGISYPSATGSAAGCVKSSGICLPENIIAQPGVDIPDVEVNLAEQAEVYNAFMEAVNSNDWLDGVISIGYYPAVALQDKSISIHGKPAEDVCWFWFEKYAGK